MIPKIIHYCWFGEKPLDEVSRKCIESWKKFFPDYQIIQWNETNFDVNQIKFMEQAYFDKKWAFVSDVARLLIIYNYGGIYFDTDVEVIASFDDIFTEETEGYFAFEKLGYVSSGVGFAAKPKHPLINQLLEMYMDLDYIFYKSKLSEIACTILITELMKKHGLKLEDTYQKICGFDVYPTEFFSPMDYYTGKVTISQYTHTIHWYNSSWNDIESQNYHVLEQKIQRVVGKKIGGQVAGIIWGIKKESIIPYVITRIKKRIF